MKMKTLLLSLVAVLALGSAANATDFTCSQTQFLVGQQSRDAQDTVTRTEVRYASNNWQVNHWLGNGVVKMRQDQYAIADTSRNGAWSWRGPLRTNASIVMVGEMTREYNGQIYYTETQYANGQVSLKTRFACSQIAALTPANPPIVTAPTPAPTTQQPSPAEQLRIDREQKRQLAAAKAEQDRKDAEAKAEEAQKQADWEADQERKKNERNAERTRKDAEATAELTRKRIESEARIDALLGQKPEFEKVIIPLKVKGNVMRLNVELGDQKVAMVLDTGATSSLITASLALSLIQDDQARYVGDSKMGTASGQVVSTKEIIIKEMKLGSHVVRNVRAKVVSGDIDLLLGADFLKTLGPYAIDHENAQLFFATKKTAAVANNS
jgi:clan AA aspartic protease (TIGR02281 family)